MYVTWCLL